MVLSHGEPKAFTASSTSEPCHTTRNVFGDSQCNSDILLILVSGGAGSMLKEAHSTTAQKPVQNTCCPVFAVLWMCLYTYRGLCCISSCPDGNRWYSSFYCCN